MKKKFNENTELVNDLLALANYIDDLRTVTNPLDWENNSVQKYLEAMSAWIRDTQKKNSTHNPSWRYFADALTAAKYYE